MRRASEPLPRRPGLFRQRLFRQRRHGVGPLWAGLLWAGLLWGSGLALTAASSGCHGSPATAATQRLWIKVESLNSTPIRWYGLVDEGSEVPVGFKPVSPSMVAQIHQKLEEVDFAAHSQEVDVLPPPDGRRMLRRVIVKEDGHTRVWTLPRGPSAQEAASFNELNRPLAQLFNASEYLRKDRDVSGAELEEQRRLLEHTQQRPDGSVPR